MSYLEKVGKNFTYMAESDRGTEKISYKDIPGLYGGKINCIPSLSENEDNTVSSINMVNTNMALWDILNSIPTFCADRTKFSASKWGSNIEEEVKSKYQSRALILQTLTEFYEENKEEFDEHKRHSCKNNIQRYLPLDGYAINCTMTMETAVDICAALNWKYNLFGTTSFDSFLDNYKKYIRVFVRSKTLNFYARSLEDICCAYCIFHCKTQNAYKALLTVFNSVVKDAQKIVKRAPQIEDTSNMYGQLLEIMGEDEEKFVKKLFIMIKQNPYNFTVRRYKEIVTNALKFFWSEGVMSEEDYNSYIDYLFHNPEVIRKITKPKKAKLLKKILNEEPDQLLYLNLILQMNLKLSAEEDTVTFLRALIILHLCKQFMEYNYTAQQLFNIINNRLTALGLSNLTYNREYCHNLFDWGVGRMIENEKQQRIRNY